MNRPLLILDLDETLIFGSGQPLAVAHDFRCGRYYIHKRPGVDAFIEDCSAVFDLAVWTSATADYAAVVVEALFGAAAPVFVWARDRCTRRMDLESHTPYWVKDLKKVKRQGYDLNRVLMVDDTANKLERNYGNLVRVTEFTGDETDSELADLAKYLLGLADEPDLRTIEKRGWRRAR